MAVQYILPLLVYCIPLFKAALSNWCIFHRRRAKRVVDTWEKQFNNATTDKKVSFLYLSNDILQNSKRKGSEFVNEFWRVLPGLLKDFYENGGQNGKKVVARLVSCFSFIINFLQSRKPICSLGLSRNTEG
jgi:hypothetical protein